jgi:hypothetical protein
MIPVTARNFDKKAFLQIKQTNPEKHQKSARTMDNRRRGMREATEAAPTMNILVLLKWDVFKFFPNLVEGGLVIIDGFARTGKFSSSKAAGLSMG